MTSDNRVITESASEASDNPVITIDGPAASGKGTLAQRLSADLGFHLLDSGLLYRIVGYSAELAGLDLRDAASLESFMHERLDFKVNEEPNRKRPANTFEVYIFKYVGVEDVIRINDANVINALRSHEVGTAASIVSAFQEVRRELIPIQRAQLQPPGLVADGRDMGTVVFPDAPLKFYLDAPLRVRAQRRREQLAESNQHATLDKLASELRARDERDRQREHAPLIAAEDAVTIDTSEFTIEEMVNHARNVIRERLSI